MRVVHFIVVSCLLIGTGCSEAIDPGRIEFQWRLGSQGCEQYGVASIRVSLYGFQSADPIQVESYNCESLQGELKDVMPGEYTLVVEGLNEDDCMTHVSRNDVTIGSGQALVVERPFSLTRYRRPIQLTWNFENQLDCLGNGVSQVEIRVEVDDEEGFTEVRACEGFSTTIQGDVAPGQLTVSIFGVNDIGERVQSGQTTLPSSFFTREPCESTLSVLTVLTECVESNCEG